MAKRGNPNMVKGAPSVNPSGRAKKAATAPGTDGVITFGGFLPLVERNFRLVGLQKWTTYQNACNEAIIALGIRYSHNLLAGTEWHCEMNPSGDPKAAQGVDIIEKGLLNADMPKPFPLVMAKASHFRSFGFSLHAPSLRRMANGLVGYASIEHRPQWTVWRFDKPVETEPLHGFWQRTLYSTNEYYIPVEEAFYCVDDTLTDMPDGSGLLRHVIELVRRLQRYQELEAIAYEFDIGGLPIGYAPIQEIANQSGLIDKDAIKTVIDNKTETLRTVLSQRAKTPEKQQYLLLDSATYRNEQDGQWSNVEKWGAKVLRADFAGAPNIAALVGRIQLEIARVFGVEFALVGGGETAGTYGMHEDKTTMLATNLEATNTILGSFATNQLARQLIRKNGLDPDTCTPKLVAEPISLDSIDVVTRSLANLQLAMLDANDPAIPVLRKRMRLPPPPDKPPPAPLPTLPRKPAGTSPLGKPGGDEEAGEDGDEPMGDGWMATLEEAPKKPGANDPGKTARKRKAAR